MVGAVETGTMVLSSAGRQAPTGMSMRRPRRALRSLLASFAAVVLLCCGFGFGGSSAGASEYPQAEFDAVWLINQTRGAVGEQAVGQDPWLTVLARIHADRLAAGNTLYHQNLQLPLSWGWRWVGENVAYSSVGLIDAHRALEASPGHLANMRVESAYAAGTGMAYGYNKLFLVQLLAY